MLISRGLRPSATPRAPPFVGVGWLRQGSGDGTRHRLGRSHCATPRAPPLVLATPRASPFVLATLRQGYGGGGYSMVWRSRCATPWVCRGGVGWLRYARKSGGGGYSQAWRSL